MHRTRLGLAFLLLLGAGTAAAPITLGARYKDESNGFQIQVPEKWDQVPTKFQEVALVGKWNGKAKRGNVTPALFVLRFLQAREAPATPREAAEQGVPGYESMMRFQEKNVWEYAEGLMWGGHQITEDDPEFKISAKGLQAHLRHRRSRGNRRHRHRGSRRRQNRLDHGNRHRVRRHHHRGRHGRRRLDLHRRGRRHPSAREVRETVASVPRFAASRLGSALPAIRRRGVGCPGRTPPCS